jgi:hypothetical protein
VAVGNEATTHISSLFSVRTDAICSGRRRAAAAAQRLMRENARVCVCMRAPLHPDPPGRQTLIHHYHLLLIGGRSSSLIAAACASFLGRQRSSPNRLPISLTQSFLVHCALGSSLCSSHASSISHTRGQTMKLRQV